MLMLPMKCAPTVVGQPRTETRRPLSRLHHWGCLGLGCPSAPSFTPSAGTYCWSNNTLLPHRQQKKSPQPSNERRQAFPPGTDVAPSVVGWQRQRQGLECKVSLEHSGAGTAFSTFSPCFFVLYLQRRRKNIESVFILFNQLWGWT